MLRVIANALLRFGERMGSAPAAVGVYGGGRGRESLFRWGVSLQNVEECGGFVRERMLPGR